MFPADHLENCEKKQELKKCTQIDVQAALMIDFSSCIAMDGEWGHSKILNHEYLMDDPLQIIISKIKIFKGQSNHYCIHEKILKLMYRLL